MTSSIEVVVPPTTYCSGSYVEGEVRLNFRHLHEGEDRFEKIWVTLRGRAYSVCSENGFTDCEAIPLVELSCLLWTHGSQYPPPGTDILPLFFRFQLPDDIPPSFLDNAGDAASAAVLYSITTVAARSGGSTKPWTKHIPIAVVPRDDVSPLLTQPLALDAFPWRTEHKEKKVRRKLWGDYATVRVELAIPDVPIFPLFTPIPFKIDVSTITAALTRRTGPDGRGEFAHAQIFPTPPAEPSGMTLQLIRRTKVRAQKWEETMQSVTTRFLGCEGTSYCDPVDSSVFEKEWVPMRDSSASAPSSSSKETGVWVQCAQFTSKLVFNVPPTFTVSDRLHWKYCLKLKVPFPGAGNDVEFESPVTIVSGISKPVPRKHHRSPYHTFPRGLNGTYSTASEVLLPWEYWQGQESWHWKEFKKGIDTHPPTA